MGRPPLPAELRKTEDLNIRISPVELDQIQQNAQAAGLTPGAYCRSVALRRQIQAPAPELNRQAYAELARAVGNLNQISHAMNVARQAGERICTPENMDCLTVELPRVAALVQLLRCALLGLPGDPE